MKGMQTEEEVGALNVVEDLVVHHIIEDTVQDVVQEVILMKDLLNIGLGKGRHL